MLTISVQSNYSHERVKLFARLVIAEDGDGDVVKGKTGDGITYLVRENL